MHTAAAPTAGKQLRTWRCRAADQQKLQKQCTQAGQESYLVLWPGQSLVQQKDAECQLR